MALFLYLLSLWLYLPPEVPQQSDLCFAEDGDHALSQQQIGNWTLLQAKCSCLITLHGSGDSEFSILTVKARPDQEKPRLSAMLGVNQAFNEDTEHLEVIINGQKPMAVVKPMADTMLAELDQNIDWIKQTEHAREIAIGPYHFSSAQSVQAMAALQACYMTLKGK